MRGLLPLPESTAQRHGWVCLLLALSFLFNPYLMAQGSGGGLNVRHPASHRATVGSSELEKFPPLAGQDSHVFVAHFFANLLSFLPNTASRSSLPLGMELLPPQQFLCVSLWFRPPPAL